jgi:PleD family two-component response regulator
MLDDSLQVQNKRVIVIDDDEGDCCLVEDILAEEGIEVVKAVGGEQGVRILGEQEFPVVITDLRMPDIDGFGIIDFIRKRHKETLIIVLTGYASIDSVIIALRLGAYDYIIKPFGPDLLKLTVKRAFEYIQLRDERDSLKQFDLIMELARTMSHEVFQPLTVLMGKTNDIIRSTDDKNIKEMAKSILAESRKIRDIIRKMDHLDPTETKSFPGGHTIIDIEKSSPEK